MLDCPKCNYDNNETFPMTDGIIYCINCGETLTDCCFCGSRKGIYRANEYDKQIEDQTLFLCEVCKNIIAR